MLTKIGLLVRTSEVRSLVTRVKVVVVNLPWSIVLEYYSRRGATRLSYPHYGFPHEYQHQPFYSVVRNVNFNSFIMEEK